MDQIIPLTSDPHQSLNVTLTVDGSSLTLNLDISFNEIAGYWELSIFDANGNPLVLAIPIITGLWPAANLLGVYSYLQIGSAYVICQSQAQMMAAQEDYPSWVPGSQELGK